MQRANEGGTWWNAARNTDAGNLTDSPQMLRLPRKKQCHDLPCLPEHLHVSVRMCFAKNAILPVQSAAPATKMSMDMSKVTRAPVTKKNHLQRASKVLCLSHKTIFDTFFETRRNVTTCHPCHAKQRGNILLQPPLKPSKMRGFAAFPRHGNAEAANQAHANV